MKKFFQFTILLLFLVTSQHTKAQSTLSDDAEISLMTTGPWPGAVYAVYGHSALYVEDDALGIDVVFNYGFFDMSQPFFMYDFIRGKTDYVLGVQSFDDFVNSYGYKGVEVTKQLLNLSQSEKQSLWEALYINHLPENREYRYNYFYDNCVTRPRDLIERYSTSEIIYPNDTKEQTYRDLIHECVNEFPWMKFGIDLIIGSEADTPITLRQKMFLPAYLMRALDESTFVTQTDSITYEIPVVKVKETITKGITNTQNNTEWSLSHPNTIAFAILLLSIFISYIQINRKKTHWIFRSFDAILFTIVGVGGLIIFFLMFFSEHPATSYNWNFAWMNILPLIFAPMFWIKPLNRAVIIYHFINFVLLSLFLFFWWLVPQQLPLATIPLAITLWLRSGSHLWEWISDRRTTIDQ